MYYQTLYCFRRPLKLHELLEELETDEITTAPDGIVIFPPENANDDVTDCDSGDEELTTINNLPGSQLRNDVELVYDTLGDSLEASINLDLQKEDSDDDNIPLALLLPPKKIVPCSGKEENCTVDRR